MVVFHGGDADLNLQEFVEGTREEGATCPVEFNAQGYHSLCDGVAARSVDEIRAYATLADKMNGPGINARRSENRTIPAGYTYLFQLVTHDLTHASVAFHGPQGVDRRTDNLRTRGLWFDTLFGGGPNVCPLAYTPWKGDESVKGARTLKLGPLREGRIMRDLARARFTKDGLFDGREPDEVLIADIRNEDNSILAQLTAFFHHYYNDAINRISRDTSLSFRPGQMPEDYARAVVAHSLREVTWYDLCRRLMREDIWRFYEDSCDQEAYFDRRSSEFSVPLEFATGVARMGHAMVRDHYQLSLTDPEGQSIANTVGHSSTRVNKPGNSIAKLPLPESWMIDWQLFFDRDHPRQQNAFAFQLMGNQGLNTASIVPSGLEDGRPLGLPFRDLTRAAFSRVPDAFEVANFLKWRRASRDAAGALQASFKDTLSSVKMVEVTRTALDELWNGERPPPEISLIADSPPLLVYMMADAWKGSGSDGQNLGVMGSILLADVIHRARREAETANPWADEIADLAKKMHGQAPREMGHILSLYGF